MGVRSLRWAVIAVALLLSGCGEPEPEIPVSDRIRKAAAAAAAKGETTATLEIISPPTAADYSLKDLAQQFAALHIKARVPAAALTFTSAIETWNVFEVVRRAKGGNGILDKGPCIFQPPAQLPRDNSNYLMPFTYTGSVRVGTVTVTGRSRESEIRLTANSHYLVFVVECEKGIGRLALSELSIFEVGDRGQLSTLPNIPTQGGARRYLDELMQLGNVDKVLDFVVSVRAPSGMLNDNLADRAPTK